MKSSIKKALTGAIIGASLAACGAGVAFAAETVYYKGDAVYWDHGRKLGVLSFSEVQSSNYEHVATANSTSSGWKKPGEVAYAEHFVGLGQAVAYWDCRG